VQCFDVANGSVVGFTVVSVAGDVEFDSGSSFD
jgi:hypothetical protein